MIGVVAWTVLWWAMETLPLAMTALLPAVLLPAAGILSANAVAATYMNDINMTILGTMFMGCAIQAHGIDRRLALVSLVSASGSVYRLVGAIMYAT